MIQEFPDRPRDQHDAENIMALNRFIAEAFNDICDPEPGTQVTATHAISMMEAKLGLYHTEGDYYDRAWAINKALNIRELEYLFAKS